MTAHDGDNLARPGIVVVTVNYRLGALGFMAHPELTAESPHRASCNYGLLDALVSLHRWRFSECVNRRPVGGCGCRS